MSRRIYAVSFHLAVLAFASACAQTPPEAPHRHYRNERQDNWNGDRDEPDQHPEYHRPHIGTVRPGRQCDRRLAWGSRRIVTRCGVSST